MHQQNPSTGFLSRIVDGIAAFFSPRSANNGDAGGEQQRPDPADLGAPILIPQPASSGAQPAPADAPAEADEARADELTTIDEASAEGLQVEDDPVGVALPADAPTEMPPLLLTREHAVEDDDAAQADPEPAPAPAEHQAANDTATSSHDGSNPETPEADDEQTSAAPLAETAFMDLAEEDLAGAVPSVDEGDPEAPEAPAADEAPAAAEETAGPASTAAEGAPGAAALPGTDVDATDIGKVDVATLIASITVNKRGGAKVPKEFFGVMRKRFGASRTDTTEMLKAGRLGYAKRGDGKKLLCAWVETVLSQTPDKELRLSVIRSTLPDFIVNAYGEHAAQGLVGAVSRCDFLTIIRDGKPIVETRARAADLIRIA